MKLEWMYQCENPKVLLLEGNDDCNIINKFCQDYNIKGVNLCNCGNDSRVLSKLNSLIKGSRKAEIIGVILDADNDIEERYIQIQKKLKPYYNLPKLTPNGIIINPKNLPKLGIWIMPNNKDNGAIEEFFFSITNIDFQEIEKCIDNSKLKSFQPKDRQKAIMQTYFAWQDNPAMPLHKAINQITLKNTTATKKFKIWLEKLFSN